MSERQIHVLEADDAARTTIVHAAGSGIEHDATDALEKMSGPAVVVVGPSFGDAEGISSIGPMLSARPTIGAILIAPTLSTEILQSALRAGFRDVLAEPLDPSALREAIDRVGTTLPGGALVATGEVEPEGPRARMITVFSTKGGAGSSMLATNVAVSLARQTGEKVVLLDADLQFGDVSVMLKLAPRHTVVDAVNSIDGLDESLLDDLLVEHRPSGVKVLSAPLEPAFAEQIKPEDLMRVVELLRSMAAYVVVDTPAYFNDVVLSLIEDADDVLLLAGMDIPNIKNVRIGLQTLRLLDTPMSKIKLVLNRSNSKVKLDVSEVERTLQVEVVCRIPSDVAVPQSVNKGAPIVTDAPKSGPAKAIDGLVQQLIQESVVR